MSQIATNCSTPTLIKTLRNRDIIVEVERSDTVADIKFKVAQIEGVSAALSKLILPSKKRALRDEEIFSEFHNGTDPIFFVIHCRTTS